jgi:hypothetical protein
VQRSILTRYAKFSGLAVFTLACAHAPSEPSPPPPPNLRSPYAGHQSARYQDPRLWLCWPGRADACARTLEATELRPDGSRVVVRPKRLPTADRIDCWYLYPTVDLGLGAGNHEDFTDLGPMTRATLAQAGWFRDVCRLYVPLYRQATFGTYLRSAEVKRRYAEVAESDVADAFLHYLGQENRGRKLVLLGHSQGAEMVVFLLRRFFDDDPVMQQRLLLAMPIGWPIEVSQAKTVGGTFAHLAVCTRKGETGCIVSYRSYVAGSNAAPPGGMTPSPGHQSVCVNPAELVRGALRPFSRALVPASERPLTRLDSDDGVMTPLVMLRDFYRGECVDGPAGYRYLAISERAAALPQG